MKAWDVSVSAPTMFDAGETIETNTTAVGGSATWTFKKVTANTIYVLAVFIFQFL